MYKPVRGLQPASFKSSGIVPNQLITFLEYYQKNMEYLGEKEAAFRIEMLVDFFKHDYVSGGNLQYDPKKLGI